MEGGDVGAMSGLASLHVTGRTGMKADAARAVQLYNRAIEEGGDVGAISGLADLL